MINHDVIGAVNAIPYPVDFGERVFDGGVSQVEIEIQIARDGAHEIAVGRIVDGLHHVDEGAVIGIAAALGIEQIGVGGGVVAEILEIVNCIRLPFEQVAAALTEIAIEEVAVLVLDDGVIAEVFPVDIEPGRSLPRRGQSHLAEELERHCLMHRRRVLIIGLEDEKPETGESLLLHVLADIDVEVRLVGAAAAAAPRADPYIAGGLRSRGHAGVIVGIGEVIPPQRSPVGGIQIDADFVDHRVVEKIASGLSAEGDCATQDEGEHGASPANPRA